MLYPPDGNKPIKNEKRKYAMNFKKEEYFFTLSVTIVAKFVLLVVLIDLRQVKWKKPV